MPLDFAAPSWLLLIPVGWALTWLIGRGGITGAGDVRRIVHLIVRCVLLALIGFALAEPTLIKRAEEVTVIAVMDVSDSVPPEQRARSEAFLKSSLVKRPPGDRLGLVTVAREALAHSILTAGQEGVLETGYIGPTDSSRVQRGVGLARAIVPLLVESPLVQAKPSEPVSKKASPPAEHTRWRG